MKKTYTVLAADNSMEGELTQLIAGVTKEQIKDFLASVSSPFTIEWVLDNFTNNDGNVELFVDGVEEYHELLKTLGVKEKGDHKND